MLIKDRRDAMNVLKKFETYAQWDGEKYFLTLETINPAGTLTIMKKAGQFYYHRKNERYWDLNEIKIDTDILTDIIWVFRAAVTISIKKVCLIPSLSSSQVNDLFPSE